MKTEKDERHMDPLFPRLHLSDADKGGPRAPPRNKMALCGQTSRSPQSFPSTSAPNSGSMSMLPLPPNGGNSIPTASSSLVGCNKRNYFPHNSSDSSHFVEILHPHSSGGMNFTMRCPDVPPVKSLNPQVLCLKGNLHGTSQLNPIQPHSLSYYNSNPSANKSGREHDFSGQKCVASGKPPYHGNIHKSADKEKMVISSSKPSLKFQSIFEKQSKDTGSMQLKYREHNINQAGDLAKCQKTELCVKLPAPHLSTIETKVVHETPSRRHSKLTIKSFVSSAPENRCGLVGDLNRCSDSNSESDEDSWILLKRKAAEDVTYEKHEDATASRCASIVEGPSCSFLPHRDNHQSPKRVKSSSDCPEDQTSGLPDVGGEDRSEGISEASSLNSRLVEKMSLYNNVIALIGQELFWKARRTIAHQQRIFALQLFELHRLTKVQKMIARSPDILLKGNFYLHQPSINFSSLKNLPCDDVLEPPIVAVEKITPAPNNFENPVDNAHLPLCKDNDTKNSPQHSAQKPNAGPPTSRSFVSDPKLVPRCFQPPAGYQWLVPIRSPSEGLVYKPYSGPCPPPGGIIAPVYGSCSPVNLSPIGGDFANVPYSVPVPTSHKQGVGFFPGSAIFDQSCIQPYSMPVIKPSASSSAIEQINPLSRIRSSEKENSPFMHDVNSVGPHKISYNVSGQKSAAMSECDWTFQVGRRSDMQGSTASNPPERAKKDALSLFPITPTAKGSEQPVQDNDTELIIPVIKVVPHNPKSASESAARIFRSIQEERKLNY